MYMNLKFDIPPNTPARNCRGCGAIIYWIVTRNGKRMPVNPDGTSHFSTCPEAGKFRKKANNPR